MHTAHVRKEICLNTHSPIIHERLSKCVKRIYIFNSLNIKFQVVNSHLFLTKTNIQANKRFNMNNSIKTKNIYRFFFLLLFMITVLRICSIYTKLLADCMLVLPFDSRKLSYTHRHTHTET